MMKGIRVKFPRPGVVELEEYDVMEPRRGEVLIENEVSLISSGTELTALRGEFPRPSAWSEYVRYPFYPGYSSVGRVVKVGEGVDNLGVGDLVAAMGPHATHFIARADDVIRVPDGVDNESAAFHTIASGVVNSVRLARVTLGEGVVVVGAGLLGQMAVQFSRLSGGFPVVAADLHDLRLKLALASGATAVVNASKEPLVEGVKRILGEADVVFEVTGNPRVIPLAIRLVRNLGRLVILSSPRGPTTLDFHDEVNRPSRIILGTHFTSQPAVETPYNPWTRRRNTELFFALLKAGIVKVAHLVTHRYSIRGAEEAYRLISERPGECLAVLLEY